MTHTTDTVTDFPSPAAVRELMPWVRVARRIAKLGVTPETVAAEVPKAELAKTADKLDEAAAVFAGLAELCWAGSQIMGQAMARSGLRVIRPQPKGHPRKPSRIHGTV
jgi:hypothetical protein